MKITSKTIALPLAAVLVLSLAGGVRAADSKSEPMGGSATGANPAKTEGNAPTRFNKASGIIGMDVRNQLDEHLGRIKDVVFDLNSERISYAVMAASGTGFLGANQKLLAVPLSALKVSSDQKYLVLNAEKSKVAAAQGIDRDNWPGVGSPSWGAEPFWQSPGKSDAGNQTSAATPAQPGQSKPDSSSAMPPARTDVNKTGYNK